MFVSKVYKLGFTSFRFVRIRVLQSRSGLSSVKHFINGNPGNLEPVPFGQFLYLDSEVSQLKPANFNNRTEASRRQHVAADIPLSAKRMNQKSLAFDEIAFAWLRKFKNDILPLRRNHGTKAISSRRSKSFAPQHQLEIFRRVPGTLPAVFVGIIRKFRR